MSVSIDFSLKKTELKTVVEENRFDLALPLVLEIIQHLKEKSSYTYFKHVLSLIEEEDLIYFLRVLDSGLMNQYSNFLIRYMYRRYKSPLTQVFKCDEMMENGKLLESEEAIKQILHHDSARLGRKTLQHAYNVIVPILIEMKRFKEARSYLTQYEQVADEPLFDRWGYYYFHAGEWDEGEECLLRGINEDPKPQFCYMLLQAVYVSQGKINEALDVLEQGIQRLPFFLPLHLEKAKRLKQLEQWEAFLEVAAQIDEMSPYHIYQDYFQYSRVQYYYEQGKFQTLQEIVRDHPNVFKETVFEQCGTYSKDLIGKMPTSIVIQKYNYCAPATASMVLMRYGIYKTQDDISKQIFNVVGSKLTDTTKYLENEGMVCQYFFGTIESYKTLTDLGVSIILCVDYPNSSHVQLLRGYDDNLQAFYIQDPNLTEGLLVSYEDFIKYYGNNQHQSIAVIPLQEKEKLTLLNKADHQLVTEIYKYADRLENTEKKAKEEFYSYVQEHSSSLYTLSFAVKMFHLEEEVELLMTSIEQLQSMLPNSDYIHLISAHALVKVAKYKDAERLLDEVKEKKTHLYYYLLGRIAFEQNYYGAAINHFKAALNVEADHYDTWSYLSLCYLYDGCIDQALRYSEISLDINNADYWNKMNHGLVLQDKGMIYEARRLYTELLKDYKKYAPAWYERARCDLQLDRLHQAMRGFRVAKQLSPEVAYPYRELATIYANEFDQVEKAIHELNEGLGYAKNDYSLLMTLAELYENQGELQQAFTYYEQTILYHPEEPYPVLSLANVLKETDQLEQSVALLKGHEERFTNDCNFLINAGEWLMNQVYHQEEHEMALSWLEKGLTLATDNVTDGWELYVRLIEHTPYNERGRQFLQQLLESQYQDNVDLICYIGCLYEKDHQFDIAKTYYEKALEQGQHTFPLYRLAELHFTQNELDVAKYFYKQVITLDETMTSVYFRLAEMANSEEDKDNEQYYLYQVLQHDPYEVNIAHLIELSEEIGKFDTIKQYIEKQGNVEECWQLNALAYIAGAEENVELELELTQAALEKDPDHFVVLEHLSMVFLKLEMFEEAIGVIRTLIEKDVEHRVLYENLVAALHECNAMGELPNILEELKLQENAKSLAYLYSAFEVEQHFLALQSETPSWVNKFSHKKQLQQVSGLLVELYNQSFRFDPNNGNATIWLCEFYNQQSQVDIALELASERIASVWNMDVGVYLAQLIYQPYSEGDGPDRDRDCQEAEQLLLQCLENESNNGLIYYHLGCLYSAWNRVKLAEQYFTAGRSLTPNDHDVFYESSRLYEKIGELEKAEELAREALQLEPQSLLARNQISILIHQQGDTETALQWIDDLLEMDETYDIAHYNKACYLSILGQEAAAYEHLKYAIENDGNIDYYKTLAQDDPDLYNVKTNRKTAKKVRQLLK